MSLPFHATSGFFQFVLFSAFVLGAIVHVVFALAVLRDAGGLRRGPDLAPPGVWALATLLAGVPVAAIYWAVHHSTLRRDATAERGPVPPAGA